MPNIFTPLLEKYGFQKTDIDPFLKHELAKRGQKEKILELEKTTLSPQKNIFQNIAEKFGIGITELGRFGEEKILKPSIKAIQEIPIKPQELEELGKIPETEEEKKRFGELVVKIGPSFLPPMGVTARIKDVSKVTQIIKNKLTGDAEREVLETIEQKIAPPIINFARKTARSTKEQISKIDRLISTKSLEEKAVASHPQIEQPIDFIWGKVGTLAKNFRDGMGVAKIIVKHGLKDLYDIPDAINNGRIINRSENRIIIDNRNMRVTVRLDLNKEKKTWLLTGYDKTKTTPQHLETGVLSPKAESPFGLPSTREGVVSELIVTRGEKPVKIPLKEEKITLDNAKAVAESAAQKVLQNPNDPIAIDESKRLFKRVAESLGAGEIEPKDLPNILTKYGLDRKQFAEQYIDTVSTAGKQLNVLSRLSKQIKAVIPEAEIKEVALNGWERFTEGFRKIENFRRSLLVTQMATTARNIISQTGRMTLQIFDDAITGTLETATKKQTPTQSFSPLVQDFASLMRVFTRSGKERIVQILDEFPLEKAKLLNTPTVEATITSKVSNALNILNRTQEYFFRKWRFDARITSEIERGGLNIKTASDIPENIISKGVNDALEVTFAQTPKRGFLNSAYEFLNNPLLTATLNPFPRFWANAMKFLWDFSPGGFTQLLNKEFRNKLLSSNPREAYSALSKATLGSMLLGGAVALRNSQFAGEKWYEIKTSENKRIDMRPFAPLSSYLFIAEALKGENAKLSGADWLQGAVSINRIAGTGLVIVDIIRANKTDLTIQRLKEIVGTWIGGFSVPFRTITDFLGQVIPEEKILRSTKEAPIISPFISAIPFVQRILPEAPRITRKEPFLKEGPALRQLTGLTIKTKNFLEKEIDRLNINISDLLPKTGDPKLNRLITDKTGNVMELIGKELIRNEEYQNLSDIEKEEFLKQSFSKVKKVTKNIILKQNVDELSEKWSQKLKKKNAIERKKFLDSLKQKGLVTPEILQKINQKL